MHTIKHILLLFVLAVLCGADLMRANEKEEATIVHPSDSPVLFGVVSTDMPPDLRKELGSRIADDEGLCVTAVSRFSPAEDAGIRPVDIILKVADRPVATKLDLLLILQQYKPGDTIPVHILRLDQTKELNLTLGSRNALQQPHAEQKERARHEKTQNVVTYPGALPQTEIDEEFIPSFHPRDNRQKTQAGWTTVHRGDQQNITPKNSESLTLNRAPNHPLLPPATMNQKTDLVPNKMEQIQCLQNTVIHQLATENPDRGMVKDSLLQIRALASGRTDQGNASIHLEDAEGQIIINGTNQHVTVETIPEKKKAGTTYRIDIPSKNNPLPAPVRERLRNLNQ